MANFFKRTNKKSFRKNRVFFLAAILGLIFIGVSVYFFPKAPWYSAPVASSKVSNSPISTVSPSPIVFKKCLAETDFNNTLKSKKQGFTQLSAAVVQVPNYPDKAVFLAGQEENTVMIPASNEKILTGAIVLSLLGPEKTFTTKVLGLGKEKILLVGGGDPYLLAKPDPNHLQAPSLSNLALQTAVSLALTGEDTVQLYWDDSLFSGESWFPDWPTEYRQYVNPVTALSVSQPFGKPQNYVPNPTAEAVNIFAKELQSLGVKVKIASKLTKYTENGPLLGQVESLPLADLMPLYLLPSDNWKAEIIARHIAIAKGLPADFSGVQKAMRQVLQDWEIWDSKANIADGSGLSGNNKISAAMLTKVMVKILQEPKLSAVAKGLPIAGINGTLAQRFQESALTKQAKGVVRAKTGTLGGVSSLTGYYETENNGLIVFALITNNVGNIDVTKNWLDNAVAKLVKSKC